MTEPLLKARRILVVEDEFLLAAELRGELERAGAIVVGWAGTLQDAMALIRAEKRLDGALLDVNLHGEAAFPAADLLIERGVRFVFVTGYDQSALPDRFADILRLDKPVDMEKLVQAMGG
ncbi:MAG: response regulator [Paracoccus sp. BP8]|nr:MAG: response regulator [Paracoccus sp. BP8]